MAQFFLILGENFHGVFFFNYSSYFEYQQQSSDNQVIRMNNFKPFGKLMKTFFTQKKDSQIHTEMSFHVTLKTTIFILRKWF